MMNNLFKRTKETKPIMTKQKLQTSYIPNNGNLKIPSREEFHRYAMNILYESCFCTDHPTDYTINSIAQSIHWTKKNGYKR